MTGGYQLDDILSTICLAKRKCLNSTVFSEKSPELEKKRELSRLILLGCGSLNSLNIPSPPFAPPPAPGRFR
jgi:hypothetical protein